MITKHTSGSSGEPVVVRYNAESRHWRDAVRWRGYGWGGYRIGMRALHYWGAGPKIATWWKQKKVQVDHLVKRDHYVDCTPRGDDALLDAVAQIRRFRPQVMVAYANGVLVARNVGELHSRTGDASLFVDENGRRINGQWPGSPSPVEHDILTGSTAGGTLIPGKTCNDWTSQSTSISATVGHADGLGPGGSTAGALSSWNSAHDNESCANTAPRGGAGRIYCFARN